MSFLAKTYIAMVCAAGTAAWVAAVSQSGISHYTVFLLCLIGACASSGMKIHLPSIKGTLSVNFLVILLGVSELSFLESLIVGCSAVLWQYIWKAKERRELIKIGFNLASSAVAITVSVAVYTAAQNSGVVLERPVVLGGATIAYFIANTALIAIVIALTEGKNAFVVWRDCYFWSFPVLSGCDSLGVATFEPQRHGRLANLAADSSVGICALPDV